MDDRNDYKFLGVTIGSANGWDGDTDAYTLYDFIPRMSIALPACSCLNIDLVEGKVEAYAEDGATVISTHDFLTVLKNAKMEV